MATAGPGVQGDNLNDSLRARGLTTNFKIKQIFDAGAGLGGPIMKDRLWFYTGHRWWNADQYANQYYNALQGTLFYQADLSRPAYLQQHYSDQNVRLTWAATSKDKVNFYFARPDN